MDSTAATSKPRSLRIEAETMASRATGIGIAIVIVAAIGAGAYYWWQHSQTPYLPPPAKKVEAPPAESTAPKHPLPVETATPLPTLAESDAAMNEALGTLLGSQA